MCVCVCECVFARVNVWVGTEVSVHPSVYPYDVCMSNHLCLCVCECAYMLLFLSVWSSILLSSRCLSVCLLAWQSICQSIYMRMILSVCLPICPSFWCLSVFQPVCVYLCVSLAVSLRDASDIMSVYPSILQMFVFWILCEFTFFSLYLSSFPSIRPSFTSLSVCFSNFLRFTALANLNWATERISSMFI